MNDQSCYTDLLKTSLLCGCRQFYPDNFFVFIKTVLGLCSVIIIIFFNTPGYIIITIIIIKQGNNERRISLRTNC